MSQFNFYDNTIHNMVIGDGGGGGGAEDGNTSQKCTDNTTEADSGPIPDSDLYYTHKTGTPKVLLIGNIDFVNSKPLPGYKKDLKSLKEMWKKFGCLVTAEKNLDRARILEETESFASRVDGNERYCVVFILSHGRSDDQIVGTDEKTVYFDEILDFFDNKNANLQGTPKLFFFQCCRGVGVDRGVTAATSAAAGIHHAGTLPEVCDTLVMFSAQPDKVAIVDHDGSWIVKDLVQVFNTYCERQDVTSMLTIVNDRISQRVVQCAPDEPELVGAKCMSEYRSTLRKKLSLTK